MRKALETTIQFLLIIFVFVIVQLIILGTTFDFGRVTTTSFWIEVAGQFALTMLTFNVIYALDRRNRMNVQTSRFFMAYCTYKLRIKELEKKKMYDDLDVAVEKENQDRLIKKCNQKLHKICTRISYDDIMDDKKDIEAEELIELFRVIPRQRKGLLNYFDNLKKKKLIRLIDKIRAGGVKYKKLSSKVFLRDKELLSASYDEYDYSNAAFELRRNLTKALSFFLCSIISASLAFSFVFPVFWIALIKNITFVLGGMASGFLSARKNIKGKTAIYENRNNFLSKNLDLNTVYDTPKEKESSKQ